MLLFQDKVMKIAVAMIWVRKSRDKFERIGTSLKYHLQMLITLNFQKKAESNLKKVLNES
jgi:hypothetical protein